MLTLAITPQPSLAFMDNEIFITCERSSVVKLYLVLHKYVILSQIILLTLIHSFMRQCILKFLFFFFLPNPINLLLQLNITIFVISRVIMEVLLIQLLMRRAPLGTASILCSGLYRNKNLH